MSLIEKAISEIFQKNFFFAVIFIGLIGVIAKRLIYLTSFPRGPWGLPLVGYIPWMGKCGHQKLAELGKKYGGIFSITLGSQTVVILNDWPAVKASVVEQTKIFSGRPTVPSLEATLRRKNIGNGHGPIWKKQRNLTVHCLRSVGMGKKSLEGHCSQIAQDIVDKLRPFENSNAPMKSMFFGPILVANWALISSYDFKENKDLKKFETVMRQLLSGISAHHLFNIIPWLRFLPPNGFGFWNLLRLNEEILSYLRKLIDEHSVNWKAGMKNDDVIDYYLSEIAKRKGDNNNSEPPYDMDYLLGSLWSLFMAGIDTVDSTCMWGVLLLAHNPDVQLKAQNEIDAVVGRHRLPNLDDFPRLPYVEAFILEVNRWACILPLALPHMATETTYINGHKILKGTTCIQNIYAVHHDPNLWDDPESIKPERFLDENNKVKCPPYYMPFSIGQRKCLGEPLADMLLKLVFSYLIHQFAFNFPKDMPKPTLEHVVGLTVQPPPFSLFLQPR
ncbi:Cytochrome P450 2 sub R member 1 [Chamberlinius hualienensis]|uniref:Cytochrome P450 3201F1 n=1 Tax=Chamberlinius hualienensis TaxID=1551368 RepID=A0A1J1DZ38_9MYRI|nr:cytochrome P450 3201F1 [Chamberlinius hualienensis]